MRLSKSMSHALRHDPSHYGLALDAEGWVTLDELVHGLRGTRPELTRADVEDVVDHGSKQRFEVDGDRIRARYGHSVEGQVALPVAEPPPVLFHGTGHGVAESIAAEGLRPMGRQYVHLSPVEDTARRVGARHGRPVVFAVDTRGAAADGVVFRCGNDDTWLADAVAARHLQRR